MYVEEAVCEKVLKGREMGRFIIERGSITLWEEADWREEWSEAG